MEMSEVDSNNNNLICANFKMCNFIHTKKTIFRNCHIFDNFYANDGQKYPSEVQ